MGRAREGTIGQNREQASGVGHIGQHEYQYRGPAPPNSHNQSISSPSRSWNIFRSRHTRYGDPTPPLHHSPSTSRDSSLPPRYLSPPPYGTPYEASSPLFEHGRRSTSSRSGSVGLVPGSQHNIATVRHADAGSRRQTAASRLSENQPMIQAFIPIHQEKPFCLLIHHAKGGPILLVHQQGDKVIVLLMDHRRDPILLLQELVEVAIRLDVSGEFSILNTIEVAFNKTFRNHASGKQQSGNGEPLLAGSE
ncbi:uncharacterized protein Bfra_005585 [Botrytis fragariae]|uniref:Uncharacterized protein n=1 Tax=Botrytis fragariae TaxID=1964551 RepID=A0A8H6AR10_9HELO|nr:uncharacterized protein Bfra_005585 [Botrytis fragariae]KAF5872231.1 hypothetical protein Bfra_005585 [Botrytis fragariae]